MAEQHMKIKGSVFYRDYTPVGIDRQYVLTINDDAMSKEELSENLKEYTDKAACDFSVETDTRKYLYQGPCAKFVDILNSARFK